MASLPRQFPDLAIHLTDQARTPIISSSATTTTTADNNNDGQPSSSSPPDPFDDCVSPTSHAAAGPPILPRPSRQQRAQALDDLTATALRARDAAARLGLGAELPTVPPPSPQDQDGPDAATASLIAALGMTPPEHLVVTYNTGAVVIETFMDHRTATATCGGNGNGNGIAPARGSEGSDGDSQAPLLVGVVAAPDAHALREARRATARLERVGRQVQQELVAQQNRYE